MPRNLSALRQIWEASHAHEHKVRGAIWQHPILLEGMIVASDP